MSDPLSSEADPFKALNLEPHFRLDLKELAQAYLRTQQRIHPDQLENNSLAQQAATRLSSRITQAYHTLKNPLGRAETILRTHQSWPLSAVEACAPDLLEEMMELQEQAEDLRQDSDQSEAFALSLKAMCAKAEQQLGHNLPPTLDVSGAASAYHRLSYLIKLRERFEERLP